MEDSNQDQDTKVTRQGWGFVPARGVVTVTQGGDTYKYKILGIAELLTPALDYDPEPLATEMVPMVLCNGGVTPITALDEDFHIERIEVGTSEEILDREAFEQL